MTVIKAISSMSRANMLICWFILACISLVKSQPLSWDGAYGINFQRSSCFESLGINRYSFTLFYNLPFAPSYINTEVDFNLNPVDSEMAMIADITNQNYLRVDNKTCSASYEFSNKGIPFIYWDIELTLNIGIGNMRLAVFTLKLDNNVGFGLHRVFDESRNFGIIINVKNTGDYVPKDSEISLRAQMLAILLTSPNNNENLCLKTDTSVAVVRPVYAYGNTPTEHISGIIVKHHVDGQQVDMVRITAYGCGPNPSDVTPNTVLLEIYGTEALLEFTAMDLLPQKLSSSSPPLNTQTTLFTLPNNEYIIAERMRGWIVDIRKQRPNTVMIPLISYDTPLQSCPDGKILILYYSLKKDNILFDAVEYRANILSTGLRVISYAQASEIKPCLLLE